MMMTTAFFHEPYPAVQNIRRLALVKTTADAEAHDVLFPDAVWKHLFTLVQPIFAELAVQVEQQHATISSRGGSTSARSYGLIFRTFYPPPGIDKEPVVVGVTIEPDGVGLVIWGDIVGEDTGEVFYESTGGRREIDLSDGALFVAAEKIVRELVDKSDCLVKALGAT